MSDDSNPSDDSEQSPKAPVIKPISVPMEVPVFNIVIYVSRVEGKVRARVANLPDLVFDASSEPAVLKLAITSVKNSWQHGTVVGLSSHG